MSFNLDDLDSINWFAFQGINYVELHNEYEFNKDTTSTTPTTGKRVFIVPWTDRFTFIELFLERTEGTAPDPPTIYPAQGFPGYTDCKAVRASIKGHGASSFENDGSIKYVFAQVTISYQQQIPTASNQPNTGARTESLELSGEVIQSPHGMYRWQSDNHPIGEPLGILLPGFELNIEESTIPSWPVASYLNYIGKINSAAFYGFPPEQALYLGSSLRSQSGTFSLPVYTAVHKWKVRTISWNKALRSTNLWEYVTPAPFASIDFNNLFQP